MNSFFYPKRHGNSKNYRFQRRFGVVLSHRALVSFSLIPFSPSVRKSFMDGVYVESDVVNFDAGEKRTQLHRCNIFLETSGDSTILTKCIDVIAKVSVRTSHPSSDEIYTLDCTIVIRFE